MVLPVSCGPFPHARWNGISVLLYYRKKWSLNWLELQIGPLWSDLCLLFQPGHPLPINSHCHSSAPLLKSFPLVKMPSPHDYVEQTPMHPSKPNLHLSELSQICFLPLGRERIFLYPAETQHTLLCLTYSSNYILFYMIAFVCICLP